MTLVQLRTIVAILDAGLNISLAAKRLGVSQPTLSKHLAQLETELGVRIFSRQGKSLSSATASGLEILTRARRVVAEIADIGALPTEDRAGGAATGTAGMGGYTPSTLS